MIGVVKTTPSLIEEKSTSSNFSLKELLNPYYSFSFLLDWSFDFLTSSFCSENDLKKMKTIVNLFPKDTGLRAIGYECPLSQDALWIDLHSEILLVPENILLLMNFFALGNWSEKIDTDALSLLLKKRCKDDLEHSRIGLEFDIAQSQGILMAPNIFMPIQKNESLSFLKDFIDWEKILPHLKKCSSHGSFIFGAGLMLGRSLRGIRICIANPKFCDLTFLNDFLKELGSEGINDETQKILSAICNDLNKINLEVDILDCVSPRIGFNCMLKKQNHSAEKKKWKKILETLMQFSCVDPMKAADLLNWFGGYKHQIPFSNSPPHMLVRNLSHIKFIQKRSTPLEAKGYLRVSNATL